MLVMGATVTFVIAPRAITGGNQDRTRLIELRQHDLPHGVSTRHERS